MATIDGTSGNDSLSGGVGDDVISGFDGNDTLFGGDGNDSIVGGDGDDHLQGNGGNDTLVGGAGVDFLTGGAGLDFIDGGDGLDVAFFEDGNVGAVINLRTGVVTNDGFGNTETIANVENLHGTHLNDVIQMGDSGSYVFGRAGADTLTGGNGDDGFIGGSGADSIDGGAGVDNVDYFDDGFDGAGAASVGAIVNLTNNTATDGWGHTDVLLNVENVSGTALGDNITGSNVANNLSGNSGDDTLAGLAGNDAIQGGDGGDSIQGGDGNDQLRGDAGNDTIRGNAGNDYITGGSGDDSLFGGGGFDTADYYFSDSNAGINASLLTGLVTGGGGNDTLSGIENINGTDFDDTIAGSALDNFIEGRGGNDSILGDAGNDNLQGGDGNDTILGGTGFDFVIGGAGNDSLDGGVSVDFYFGTDQNSISYSGAAAGVLIDARGITGDGSVGSGIANDGLGGVDTFANFNGFTGASFNDLILGSAAQIFESFDGGLGDDIINGGAFETVYLDAFNQVSYQNSPGAVLVDLRGGFATGASGNDTLLNIHRVRGSSSADTLYGTDTTQYAEEFEGRGGNDTIDGRGGSDRVRYNYLSSSVGVYANLATGIAIAGANDVDTLINIERVRGSQYNDTLIGGNPLNGADQFDGFEQFRGDGGNDFIDGGDGFDEAQYSSAGSGIYVVLGGAGAGYAFDGSGGIDTLWNIEQLNGSYYDDYMQGSDAEFESFDGNSGNDTIDGKGGTDRVVYFTSRAPVNVNLTTGIATEYFRYGGEIMGTDTLLNIEWARGSENFGDTLIGSAAANKLEGNGGDDTIDGMAGIDTMEGGNGSDTYYVRDVGDIVTETNRLRATGGDDIVYSSITAAMSATGFVLGDYVEILRIDTTAAANGSGNSLDNTIVANLGDNILDGGTGDDTVSFELATNAVAASIAGTAIGVQATGGSGNDTLLNFENIIGGAGNDSLTGGAGANRLTGGAGADTLTGDLGNDIYDVDNAGDVIVETSALVSEIDEVNSSVTYSLGALVNVENLRLTGSATINATGNALANLLAGNDGNNNLNGADGNDTLDGGQGDDTMVGGVGDDVYLVNSANDVVTELFNQGTDLIRSTVSYGLIDTDGAGINGGNVENLELVGNGAINGTGNSLNNIIYAGAGNNLIDGGGGTDTVSYAYSQIAVVATLSNQGAGQFTNGSGTDTFNGIAWLEGSAFNDTLSGDANANRIIGLAGNDTINIFQGGNDTALGGGGGDSIYAGGVGSNLIDGGVWLDLAFWGRDQNYVSYQNSSVAVVIDFSGVTGGNGINGLDLVGSGTANKGANGTDTLINVNSYAGSPQNDSITGSSARQFEWFQGGLGDDTLNGGLIIDLIWGDTDNRVFYGEAGAAVTVNLGTGVVTGGAGNDTISNMNSVTGSAFSDVLTGSSSSTMFESFEGRGGDDTIDGGPGQDRARYNNAPSAVYVDLAAGYALDGYGTNGGPGGTDTLIGIERINGSAFNDTLIGGAVANGVGATDGFEAFRGFAGNDTIDGGAGYDVADYDGALEGVLVRLGGTSPGIAYDGQGGVDTLINIEGVTGGNFADRLFGSDTGVFESFRGAEGNDTIDGKGGIDRVDYNNSRAAAVVNLLTGTASDGLGGTDTLLNIEDIRGSVFNDNLFGTLGNNKLSGEAGNDTIAGDAGFDSIDGGDGNDNLNGGINGDTINGGLGNDIVGGGQGLDVLNGGDGNDTITGGLGSDNLTGGDGADRFAFKHALAGNIDTITDFATGVDVIELSAAIFGALAGQVGTTVGTSANITYNNVTGVLAYDADGAGLGGPVTFAILGSSVHPITLGNDFAIVA